MKDDNHLLEVHQDAAQECRFKLKWLLLFICLINFSQRVQSQCTFASSVFHEKEEINYDVYFKWGILMPKAGVAKAQMFKATYEDQPAWMYQLLVNSVGVVDKAFRVRDTIDTYFSYENPRILFSSKRTNEGGYYQIDRLTFSGEDKDPPYVHSFRRSKNSIKLDSVMYGERCIHDMLGALTFIRTIDWSNMQTGDEIYTQVAMGRDMINVSYRYVGQRIIERGNAKYKTRLFVLDIFDESFSQTKEAAEIWIGDDDNHVPIKIRAKLKIGAGEAYYNSSLNLKHPLKCRIEVPKRYATQEEELLFDHAFTP